MKYLRLCIILLLLIHYQLAAQTTPIYEITGEPGELFGLAFAMSEDGQRIAVGAPLNDINGTDAGKVQVFDFNGSDWVQVGANILGPQAGDRLGYSLDISGAGDRLVIGAPNSDETSGKVYVFDFDGTNWVEIDDVEVASEFMGKYVSIAQNGSRFSTREGGNSMRVYQFNNSQNRWSPIGNPISTDNGGMKNASLSFDGNVLAVSGVFDQQTEFYKSSKVFTYSNGDWIQLGDQTEFLNMSGCSYCPPLYSSRTYINNTMPHRVVNAIWAEGTIYQTALFVTEYDVNQNKWYNIDTSGSAFMGANAISIVPFMLSDSGNFFFLLNDVDSELIVYQYAPNDWTELVSIPIEEQNFTNTFFIVEGFDGLVFHEEEGLIGVSLPTLDKVQFFDLNSVLNTTDNETTSFKLYPNPAKGLLFLDANYLNDISTIEIYDQSLRLIREHKNFSHDFINISDLASGIYFFSIQTRNRQSRIVKKIIVE